MRGLTTAASIWITAAIGILAGIGFYFPLTVTTVLTLGHTVRVQVDRGLRQAAGEFSPDTIMPEDDFRRFIADHGFTIADLNYHYSVEPGFLEYGMVIRTQESANASRLSEALRKTSTVQEFRLSPMGD